MNNSRSLVSSGEGVIGHHSHHFLRLVVTLCYLAVGLSVIPVPVMVRQGFHADEKMLGLVMGIYAFTAIPARIFTGIAMRRFGYRSGLIAAALLLSASSLVCAWSDSVNGMLFGRILLGVGTGAMMAVATAWMVELPAMQSQMGKAIGSVGTINYAVLALSAPLATLICHAWGAQQTLFIAALFPLLALLIIPKLATVPVGPCERNWQRATNRVLLASIVPGLALLLSGIGYAGIVSFGLEIGVSRHLSAGASLVLVFGITMVAARVLFGNLTHRFSGSVAIMVVFALEAAGLLLLAYSQSNAGLWTGAVAIGLAMSFIYPMLGIRVSHIAGSYRGSALSVFGAFINAGIGAGSIMIGFLSAHWTLAAALKMAALSVLGGCLLAALLPVLELFCERYFSEQVG
ncbi:MFS transporter [Leclercia sp. 119287]|uniref:MFS transporter n=1 Tax=Leclercia sp. 119287 TaxID=2681308 RepID=UPI0012E1A0F0|nr:MFS transporter [Leclercia sp. 119287]QGU16420.1 MFS transporter [Leclercia sp. 119287]